MKLEEIKSLFVQFEQASAEVEDVECWSARELQSLLGCMPYGETVQWQERHENIEKKIIFLQR